MSRLWIAAVALMLCVACDNATPVQPPPPPPIENHRPTANIGGPYTGVEGTSVPFDAHGSTDPDGDSLTYKWVFEAGKPGATGVTAAHVYADNGDYPLALVVSDSHDAADTATAEVSVANAAPEISILRTLMSPLALGSVASVQVSFADPGSADILTATVDWGDGHLTEHTPVGVITHAYATTGGFVVRLTVRDDDGGETTRSAATPIDVYDPNANQAEQAGYEVIDLGTLGGNSAYPSALNDRGQVVGSSLIATGERHAFIWEDGIMHDLAPDLPLSSASEISNSGTIVGHEDRLEYGWPIPVNLLLWAGGVRTNLGKGPEGGRPYPVAIDDAGQLLTRHYFDAPDPPGGEDRSVFWRNGATEVLGGLGGFAPNRYSSATAMNASAQIVGSSLVRRYGEVDHVRHAFLWQDGVMHDLGVLGDFACEPSTSEQCGTSSATDVNIGGQIVGVSTDTEARDHAVLWANGTIRDLGLGFAVAINDVGDVTGINGRYSFFWRSGTVTSLGSLGGIQRQLPA